MRLMPDVGEGAQGQTQTGSWTIVGGTDALEGLRGSGRCRSCPARPTTRRFARRRPGASRD